MGTAAPAAAQPERTRTHQLHPPERGGHSRPKVWCRQDQRGGSRDRQEPGHARPGPEGAGAGWRPRRRPFQKRSQRRRADGLFVSKDVMGYLFGVLLL